MVDLETKEIMRKHGFSEEMIAKCDNADKSKFRYEPPLDEFRKKMHELGWDDEDIDFTIKIAEDVAPLQDNIVWLKPSLVKRHDIRVEA